MSQFKLPDLGEGLQEAEIVEWYVKAGDEIQADQKMLAVETAKAIVDVPSPQSGKVTKLLVQVGDIPKVGDPLIEFASEGETAKQDSGTVVGHMESGKGVLTIDAVRIGPLGTRQKGGTNVVPAMRAMKAERRQDIQPSPSTNSEGMEPLRGVRRAMAYAMTKAHEEVADVTICDDADIHAWPKGTDPTMRLIRAMAIAANMEPSVNALYDSQTMSRKLVKHIDLGIAVDTKDGLFVPVLRNIGQRATKDLRAALNQIKEDLLTRTIPPEEMRDYTITLSNFGTFGGRYADPIVVPPTVAILGAGRMRDEVVAVDGEPQVHRIMPLSLTVDHRAVTGGEATRFLMAVIKDLQKDH